MKNGVRRVLVGASLAGVALMAVAGWWIGKLMRPPEPVTTSMSGAIAPPKPRVADLQADWSNTENPHRTEFGIWSYNQDSSPLSPIDSWPAIPGISGVSGWGPAANRPGEMLPFVFRMPPNLQTPDVGADFEAGDIVLHSTDTYNGARNGQGNVVWKSSFSGKVMVSGRLWPLKRIRRQNTWELLLIGEGRTVLATGELPEDDTVSRKRPSSFKFEVAILEGDQLKLQVRRSTRATDTAGDFAGMMLTITEKLESETAEKPASASLQGPVAAPSSAAPVGSFLNIALMAVIFLLGVIAAAMLAIVMLLLRRPPTPNHGR